MEDQVQWEPDMFEYEPHFLSGATTNDYFDHLLEYHFLLFHVILLLIIV